MIKSTKPVVLLPNPKLNQVELLYLPIILILNDLFNKSI